MPWEEVRELFRFPQGRPDPACEFVFPSPMCRGDDFLAYARPSFALGRPLLDAAMDLTLRIHADFLYDSESTEISTPVESVAQRRGVCQDFAHHDRVPAHARAAGALRQRLPADSRRRASRD